MQQCPIDISHPKFIEPLRRVMSWYPGNDNAIGELFVDIMLDHQVELAACRAREAGKSTRDILLAALVAGIGECLIGDGK